MRILFAIQGTGNGHLSRARDIYPELCKYGKVDVLISGIQADVDVPFPVTYKLYGMSFIFGKHGGVDILATARALKIFRLMRDIKRLPVKEYDLVINDFEPVSAWACKRQHVTCISLSHQCAVLHKAAPRPSSRDKLGELILKRYAPCSDFYGFHFSAFAPNIFTPVIRKEIRDAIPVNEGHYTVYLPAYDDKTLIRHLSAFRNVKWQVFSKHNSEAFTLGNISLRRIDSDAYIKSLVSSAGVLCGAGFEGPAEALYLGKKLLAIPMKGQYEQHCNAAGLAELGVPVIPMLNKKYYTTIWKWLGQPQHLQVDYPDQTENVIHQLIHKHANKTVSPVTTASTATQQDLPDTH